MAQLSVVGWLIKNNGSFSGYCGEFFILKNMRRIDYFKYDQRHSQKGKKCKRS